MIIQTGMRTDIPAFYAKWFANRIREGYVCTRNPYDLTQVTRYSLSPDVVDVIGFCTKNPAPMFPYSSVLEPYGQFWFVTITPYGPEIELNVPDKNKVTDDFIRLSQMVGPAAMAWRYDPIFLSERYTVSYHIQAFEQMARKLSGYTKICVISFIDLYEKTKKNFPQAERVKKADRIQLGRELIDIAAGYGMTIRPCAEGDELAPYGADCAGCIRQSDYEAAIGAKLDIPKLQMKSPRAECACVFGRDIGQYNTCGHFCKYCYANSDVLLVRQNMKRHDPQSPFLIGHAEKDDVVHEAKQTGWKNGQLSIFDFI